MYEQGCAFRTVLRFAFGATLAISTAGCNKSIEGEIFERPGRAQPIAWHGISQRSIQCAYLMNTSSSARYRFTVKLTTKEYQCRATTKYDVIDSIPPIVSQDDEFYTLEPGEEVELGRTVLVDFTNVKTVDFQLMGARVIGGK